MQPRLDHDCWFLSGPTAAGKTALAIAMAKHLNAQIVSVDSMAVYRGLDIGTAKPSPQERLAVPHHHIDVADPTQSYSVARWLDDATRAVETIRSHGQSILFVGGTPLYLRMLRDGLSPLPETSLQRRTEFLEELSRIGMQALHERLRTLDPIAAFKIHPHDTRRVIRALEVISTSGLPLSQQQTQHPNPILESHLFVLDIPRAILHKKIDERTRTMFENGIVDEVFRVTTAYGPLGLTASQATGYREALEVLAGRMDREEAVLIVQRRTRQLAKRQLTWLRGFPGARWITA